MFVVVRINGFGKTLYDKRDKNAYTPDQDL
jgi:hypothetical protein